jgi:hypothetical protein
MMDVETTPSGLVVPQKPYHPCRGFGPVKIGEMLPWKGLWFSVVAIAARDEHDALVTLKPMQVIYGGALRQTKGARKKKR